MIAVGDVPNPDKEIGPAAGLCSSRPMTGLSGASMTSSSRPTAVTRSASYQNAAYVIAYKTRTDHWDLRNRKGYVFFFGDEMNHPFRKEEVINPHRHRRREELAAVAALRDLYDMVKERYHTSLCCPRTPTMAAIRRSWNTGRCCSAARRCCSSQTEVGLPSEFVAAQIGLIEENTDIDSIARIHPICTEPALRPRPW